MASIFHPEAFHGRGKTKDFFEGWYVKCCTSKGECVAIVPGIFHGSSEEASHAFIFVNVQGEIQHYFKFPLESFVSSEKKYETIIDKVNVFNENGFTVDLKVKKGDDASANIIGSVKFKGNFKWPVSYLNPGVMGVVAYFPFVECSHGIVSMDHKCTGNLQFKNGENNENNFNFDGSDLARGYMEKDWGKHFPSSWVWLQTNCFPKSKCSSLFFSAAFVPYMGSYFPGFICGFYHEDELHKFASYNLSSFNKFKVDEEKKTIKIHLQNMWGYHLEITTKYADVPMVPLYGPSCGKGIMEKNVREGLQATIGVKLSKGSKVLFDDKGQQGGIEAHGDLKKLCKSLCKN